MLQITRLEPYSSLPVAQFWVSSSLLNQMAAQLKYLRLVITTLAEHRTHDIFQAKQASGEPVVGEATIAVFPRYKSGSLQPVFSEPVNVQKLPFLNYLLDEPRWWSSAEFT